MLLGELAVDQRAYAEVGTPVAARVTRLLVNAGDPVRSRPDARGTDQPGTGRERAEYLSASARLTLAEAALERKRGLAAEKIVPLREVQEAESAAGEARAALRASRAAIAAFGVEPPADDGDDATSSAFVLRSPVAGSVIERTAVVGSDARPGGASLPHRQPLDALADGSRFRARRGPHPAGRRRAPVVSRASRAGLRGHGDDGRASRGARIADGPRQNRCARTAAISFARACRRPRRCRSARRAQPILTVPVASVQRVRNEWCVFLPKDANHFEIRRIGRGRDLGGEVEVLSGLRAGETIVVDGAFLLKAQAEKGEADHDAH